MKTNVEDKLDRIADIWNDFIWDFKFCSSRIKFNDDVKTNYFGDILGYFKDTLDIIFQTRTAISHADKFSFSISFLQAIYIQQDFVEEMLGIFKTGIDKGKLKQDSTYYINRELRNELIGHPIRKFQDRLISSTLFSYQGKVDEIQYLRYHADNEFKSESKTFSISEIQERHEKFLNKYFDEILTKLRHILDEYLKGLEKLESVIENKDFKTVLKFTEIYFEDIFQSDFIYDKDSLIKVYNKKHEHQRYRNFIDLFYNDLKKSIMDKKKSISDIFEKKQPDYSEAEKIIFPEIEFPVDDLEQSAFDNESIKETYHYEIGKIATKRNSMDFGFFGGLLRHKCSNNRLILSELNHMEKYIHDEIEYYTSLRLICAELKEE